MDNAVQTNPNPISQMNPTIRKFIPVALVGVLVWWVWHNNNRKTTGTGGLGAEVSAEPYKPYSPYVPPFDSVTYANWPWKFQIGDTVTGLDEVQGGGINFTGRIIMRDLRGPASGAVGSQTTAIIFPYYYVRTWDGKTGYWFLETDLVPA